MDIMYMYMDDVSVSNLNMYINNDVLKTKTIRSKRPEANIARDRSI